MANGSRIFSFRQSHTLWRFNQRSGWTERNELFLPVDIDYLKRIQ